MNEFKNKQYFVVYEDHDDLPENFKNYFISENLINNNEIKLNEEEEKLESENLINNNEIKLNEEEEKLDDKIYSEINEYIE